MARRRRSYALARRAPARRRSGTSGAYMKLRKKAEAANRRASSVRRNYAGKAGAMKTGLTVVAGGALGGVMNALAPAGLSIMGAAPDATLAIGLLAIGMSQNKATPIHLAAGIAATYASEWAAEAVSGLQSGEGVFEAVGLKGNG
jgi:hypothetical protein